MLLISDSPKNSELRGYHEEEKKKEGGNWSEHGVSGPQDRTLRLSLKSRITDQRGFAAYPVNVLFGTAGHCTSESRRNTDLVSNLDHIICAA